MPTPSSPAEGAHASPAADSRFFTRVPLAVWLVALAAAVLHLLPVWHAQSQTPPGWEFTGNVTQSTDYMQYRGWMRQTAETGAVVWNKFTGEPNPPYLPVPYYWTLGAVGRALGVAPELVNAYAGSVFAFGLALLLFLTARYFLGSNYRAGWVYVVVLFGGGVTAHLKLLHEQRFLAGLGIRRLVSPVENFPTFETSRCHYLISTLFDSHFLLIWLVALVALLSLYFALKRPALWRSALTALLFAFASFLHVYEGITLLAGAGCVLILCWRKRLAFGPALRTAVLCGLAVAACYAYFSWLLKASGLPYPGWRPPQMPSTNVFLAFPLAWILIGWGLVRYWREARLEQVFLIGWALGCTLLVLGGPYYPYHDRGTITMQIPVYLIAAGILFERVPRLPLAPAVLAAVLLFGATPYRLVRHWWTNTQFRPDIPWTYLDASHREILDALREASGPDDVLVADLFDYRWLAPDHPGRSYSAHFFLTVDYERKAAAVERFFEDEPAGQLAFLEGEGIHFLFVNPERDPRRFEGLPGLAILAQNERGTLFRVEPGTGPRLVDEGGGDAG